ncbi:hypothetical protein RFN28_13815 [Mesorhizobium sp. VK24D]|uniref:Uncharacterized protein n=1 Tax=Mesorhizobium album TaxID=3072314 RepID=A0ABU4XXX0_9HYPH|nr:hypothetical protein [Mesorhizobium sp. VK24D]MDX8479549.1 hypothetical protein [Mesorhizobium sp. VK24D]
MVNDLRDPDIRGYLCDDVDPGLRAYILKVYDFIADACPRAEPRADNA